jgi:hypothetical protein
MYKVLFAVFITLFAFGATVAGQERTTINDAAAAKMLLGRHMLSLQWISWEYFGTATVTSTRGIYRITGQQRGRGESKGDYLRIDGVITSIDAREFKFSGKIEMRISHINNGEPCIRDGEFTFAITGKRRYWRMREMENPCDTATDYVDIYFR